MAHTGGPEPWNAPCSSPPARTNHGASNKLASLQSPHSWIVATLGWMPVTLSDAQKSGYVEDMPDPSVTFWAVRWPYVTSPRNPPPLPCLPQQINTRAYLCRQCTVHRSTVEDDCMWTVGWGLSASAACLQHILLTPDFGTVLPGRFLQRFTQVRYT